MQDDQFNDKNRAFGDTKVWYVSESALLDGLVDFGDYFRNIRQQVEKKHLQDTELTIKDIYTISHYRLKQDGEIINNIEAWIEDWLAEDSLRQLALLGEYGQGKSTLSLMLSYRFMQQIQAGNHRIRTPILLTLRGKSPRNLPPDEILSTWAGRFGIDPRALMKLLIAGRLLLIFEGFDEVDLAGDSEARLRHFQSLWALCYRHAKILITGRPNFFLDDEELKRALGIQQHSLERPYCQASWLAHFDQDQMREALRNETQQTRDEILALAAKDEKFVDVISRPSMLRIVSFLWQREKLSQYQQCINSALVMDLFIRHTLERQAAKSNPSQYMQLNAAERDYFMVGVAVFMLVKRLPNQISHQQLDQVVRLLVGAIPDAVSCQGDALSGNIRPALRTRLQGAEEGYEKALDGVKTDVRSCGLLEKDLSRSGSFRFGHKSFMEFLAGKVYAQWWMRKDLVKMERLSTVSLCNHLGLKHEDILHQSEPLSFAVEWVTQAKDYTTETEKAQVLFDFIFNSKMLIARKRAEALKMGLFFYSSWNSVWVVIWFKKF